MLGVAPVKAHEFWLEASTFTPVRNQNATISIFIGQKFKGNSYPFLREEFKRFAVITPRGERPVKGVPGDDPALNFKFSETGLIIFAHHSTPETLTFDSWELFLAYLQFEGLEHILALHDKLGKPRTGIREIYTRCAKLLVAVDGGDGQDRQTGLPLELVAEENPYKLREGDPLQVRLYFKGKPIEGIAISAIAKADPEARQLVRTNAEGRASIALPNSGPWLLNAVHVMEPARGENAHWTSLWASLTFARP
jgi:hypothetical protein